MADTAHTRFSRIVIAAKNALFSLVGIIALSAGAVAFGRGERWVLENISTEWIWLFYVGIGTLLFSIGVLIFEGIHRAENLKSEFITIAAHRIRTPLTRIQWMISEVAVETGLSEGNQLIVSLKEILGDLTKASNELLNAAEAGKTSLFYDYIFEREHLDLIVRQVVAEYAVGATQKNIGMTVDIDGRLPEVVIDRERMKTAMGAIIENAIIYTPHAGTIEIKMFQQKKNIIFSVKDSGIGIPKEMIPFIFSKFFRTKEAVSLDRDRAGLGLFIAREIIERHGGDIYAESEGNGRGSHFWFSIPLR